MAEHPVHFTKLVNGTPATYCGAKSVHVSGRREDITCHKCLSAIAPSWWRLQIEHRPGNWIDTPIVKRTVQRPRTRPWQLSREDPGKPTRWKNVGGLAEWGDNR